MFSLSDLPDDNLADCAVLRPIAEYLLLSPLKSCQQERLPALISASGEQQLQSLDPL